jgi:lysozyme
MSRIADAIKNLSPLAARAAARRATMARAVREPEPAVPEMDDATRILGCDVSHWQGEIDWPAMRASGLRFAIVKASQAAEAKRWPENRAGARAAGLVVGAYHFAVTSRTPKDNIATFARAVGAIAPDELPPVLDLEDRGMRDPPRLLAWCRAALVEMADRTGRRPLLYSTWSFMRDHLGGRQRLPGYDTLPELADLWIVRYRDGDDPGELGPWPEWVVWQWTNNGVEKLGIKGVRSRGLDLDWTTAGALRRVCPVPPRLGVGS